MNEGLVDSGVFSFYIHRDSSHVNGDHEAELKNIWHNFDKNFDFCTNFTTNKNIIFFANFGKKIYFFANCEKNSIFAKIYIFCQNLYFLPKFIFLTKLTSANFQFVSNISIEIIKCWIKFRSLANIMTFHGNYDFWWKFPEIVSFYQNFNFYLDFWLKTRYSLFYDDCFKLCHKEGGEIAWGGVNPDRFEGTYPDAFQWVEVSRKAYWQISMGTVTVEDTDKLVVCETGCEGRLLILFLKSYFFIPSQKHTFSCNFKWDFCFVTKSYLFLFDLIGSKYFVPKTFCNHCRRRNKSFARSHQTTYVGCTKLNPNWSV